MYKLGELRLMCKSIGQILQMTLKSLPNNMIRLVTNKLINNKSFTFLNDFK